jgi:hypothetical protein
MFFRIWFIGVSKVAFLALLILTIGFVTHFPWSHAALRIGIWTLAPIAAFNALMVLSWPFTGARMRCPICGSVGKFVNCGRRQPGVECPKCGVVCAADILLSCRLTTIAWKPDEEDTIRTVEDGSTTPSAINTGRIPTFPRGVRYFRSLRTLRWFLLMLVPVSCSALGAFLRHGIGIEVFGVVVLGIGFTAMLFVDLYSRVSSSNWGTFSRSQEPIHYWFGTGVWIAAYVLISVAGYFVS